MYPNYVSFDGLGFGRSDNIWVLYGFLPSSYGHPTQYHQDVEPDFCHPHKYIYICQKSFALPLSMNGARSEAFKTNTYSHVTYI
jgi:hypothetical protein